jgi:hypothetical protein
MMHICYQERTWSKVDMADDTALEALSCKAMVGRMVPLGDRPRDGKLAVFDSY